MTGEPSERPEPPPDRSAWRERPRVDPPELGETSAGMAGGWRDRPLSEFRNQYRKEHIEPDTAAAEHLAGRPHQDPREFVATVNPHAGDGRPWQTNCSDCARAVERSWRGHPEVAAGDAHGQGEPRAKIQRWAGSAGTPMESLDAIGERLRAEGHGASALVRVDFEGPAGPGAHRFNAVNHQGRVLFVDGQLGRVTDWPPEGQEWQRWPRRELSVIGFDRDGRAWR